MGANICSGIRPAWLLWGEEEKAADSNAEEIPVIGYAGVRKGINLVDGENQAPIDLIRPLKAADIYLAVVVKGASMSPTYRDGDALVLRKDPATPDQIIGRDCVVITERNRVYVKQVKRSQTKGRYDLLGFNSDIEPIMDVLINRAWPIEWVRRK